MFLIDLGLQTPGRGPGDIDKRTVRSYGRSGGHQNAAVHLQLSSLAAELVIESD